MPEIAVIAHNIRSTHNIGSIIRTCEGLGVTHLYITGYSPYPVMDNDTRLPHISHKISAQISKTSLGAETTLPWTQSNDVHSVLQHLKVAGYTLAALEQTQDSVRLPHYITPNKIALLLGEEVAGVPDSLLSLCDVTLEIPMYGKKESFNVSVAAGIALYQLRFYTPSVV